MSDISKKLLEIGEIYATGYFEDIDRSYFYRTAKAMLRYREHCTLPPYNGGKLYPNSSSQLDRIAIEPRYSYVHTINPAMLNQKSEELCKYCTENMPFWRGVGNWHANGAIYGGAFNHTTVNYPRVLREGLDSYRERVMKIEDTDMREGCLLVLDSINIYRERCLKVLREVKADENLIKALSKVPFRKAETLYEALVGWNFIYYVDFGDNIGVFDKELDYWHNGEDVTDILREFYRNIDANNGWSLRVGPEIYPITYQILKASKGIRRPSVELCIDDTTPQDIWDLSVELIKSGNTNPSFYNYPLYQKALKKRFPMIPESDIERFCGGGCTETMLSGISRVGSIDGNLNTAYVFCNYMNENLAKKETFEEFYSGAMDNLLEYADELYADVNECYKHMSEKMPNPVRTLLVDDCIDKGKDYNADGARWSWSIVNFSGTINVIESLLAIRDIVYEKKEMGAEEFLELLNSEDELFYKRLKKCPHYGVNDEKADSLAKDFFAKIFGSNKGKKLHFGEGFLTSSIQFTTYVYRGKGVGPTPDGRKNGEPLCDSLSPIFGNDKKAVTSMLGSVAKLDLPLALGTPVVNLRLAKKYADSMIKPMIKGYFENGGMMLQINCVSKEEMEDAMVNPDKHRDLMVRMGGYTEYFVNLSKEEQATLLTRTEHGE
ncbi:MAG: hypothetical protein IJD97_11935 [Clostridia bacterium]|nr:hypothetical protein [Clostridia bacterium]